MTFWASSLAQETERSNQKPANLPRSVTAERTKICDRRLLPCTTNSVRPSFEAASLEHPADFRIGHEQLPNQPRAIVFDHDRDRRLIEAHENRRIPICIQVKSIARTIHVPERVAQIAIKMFQRRHRSLWCVRKRRKRTRRRHRPVIVLRIGSMRTVTRRSVARGEPPAVCSVSFVTLRIPDAVIEI